ncbi:MAG: ribosome silencing factor [Phycisphaerae bacterium]
MTEVSTPAPELQLAIDLARLADQTRCQNVVLLDVRQKSPVTKFFLIVTGTSDRQRRTVADELVRHGKIHNFPAWRTNGYETAKWIVVDFIDVVAHIFEEASRRFYDLEMLWGDCPRVAWQGPLPDTATPAEQPAVAPAPVPDVLAEVSTEIQEPAESGQTISEVPASTEIEEFVDNEMLTTEITESGEVVEEQEVEITAVLAREISKPIPKKRPLVKPGKRRAKIAPKTTGAAKRRGHLSTAAPVRTSKPSSGKKSTTVKARLIEPNKRKTVVQVRAGRPALKKTAAQKQNVGKLRATKKAAVQPQGGKSRVVSEKSVKKPKIKGKKGKF